MDKTALVSFEVGQVSEMLRALEAAGLKLEVAVGGYFPEYEEWRLVLAARKLDSLGIREAYGFVRELLAAAGFTYQTTPEFMIFSINDPFIKALRRRFGRSQDLESRGIGHGSFGDRYLKDGVIYRLI